MNSSFAKSFFQTFIGIKGYAIVVLENGNTISRIKIYIDIS